MRIASIALVLGLLVGCAAPPAVIDGLEHELQDLRQLEVELLPLVPDGPPVDFGGGVRYRPRDGWRVTLRAMQLRAASLLAWARNETFDQAAGLAALVAPALAEAQRNAKEPE